MTDIRQLAVRTEVLRQVTHTLHSIGVRPGLPLTRFGLRVVVRIAVCRQERLQSWNLDRDAFLEQTNGDELAIHLVVDT